MKQVQFSQSLLPRDIPDPWSSFTGQVVQCFSCTVGPRTGHSTSDMESLELSREAGSAPLTGRAHSSWCTPQYHWLSWPQGHCWLIVNLSPTKTPRFFSAKMLSSRSSTNPYSWLSSLLSCILYRIHYCELCLWGKNRKKEECLSWHTLLCLHQASPQTPMLTLSWKSKLF